MKITKWKENKDGTVDMTYSLSAEEQSVMQALAKKQKKTFNDEFINSVIEKALKAQIKKWS